MGRVQNHNGELMTQAKGRAEYMQTWPSPLEERMKNFLDNHSIHYEFQKIFYIYADDGWIIRYYIADFYLPESKIIIEVDGKFHDNQKQHDKNRTKDIVNSYPGIEVFRYRWTDLSDDVIMDSLLKKISQRNICYS